MRFYNILNEKYHFEIDPQYETFYDINDNAEHSILVPINISKLDKLWSKDHNFYIGKNGIGQIGTRYERFGEFIKSNPNKIYAPHISINDRGEVMFGNGRHRFSWFRDNGYDTIPVSMDKDSYKNAKRIGLL